MLQTPESLEEELSEDLSLLQHLQHPILLGVSHMGLISLMSNQLAMIWILVSLTMETISANGMLKALTFFHVEAMMMMTLWLLFCVVHAVVDHLYL